VSSPGPARVHHLGTGLDLALLRGCPECYDEQINAIVFIAASYLLQFVVIIPANLNRLNDDFSTLKTGKRFRAPIVKVPF